MRSRNSRRPTKDKVRQNRRSAVWLTKVWDKRFETDTDSDWSESDDGESDVNRIKVKESVSF